MINFWQFEIWGFSNNWWTTTTANSLNLPINSLLFSSVDSTLGLIFALRLLVFVPFCSKLCIKLDEGDCKDCCNIWGGLVFGIGEFNICWYDWDFLAIAALPLPSESLWFCRGRWFFKRRRSSISRSLKSLSLLLSSSYSYEKIFFVIIR